MDDELFIGLEKIRKKYLEDLFKESEDIIDDIQATGDEQKRYDLMNVFSHQIYGSGSSYGYDFISKTGEKITIELKKDKNYEVIIDFINDMLQGIIEKIKEFQ